MIFVDQPLWRWHGDRWAHLISDSDLAELHDFAETIGKRRVGFQGDHYDVRISERERALAAGAQEIDAREVVRKLNATQLRRRGGLPKWNVVWEQQCAPQAVPKQVRSELARSELGGAALGDCLSNASAALLHADSAEAGHWRQTPLLHASLLERAGEAALLLSKAPAAADELPAHQALGSAGRTLGVELGISEVRKPTLIAPFFGPSNQTNSPVMLGLDLLASSG